VTTAEEFVMFSFSQQQIAHFQAFGFVVLRGLLNEAETAALTREVNAALSDAFGGSGTGTSKWNRVEVRHEAPVRREALGTEGGASPPRWAVAAAW
jgi:hypothetical protein